MSGVKVVIVTVLVVLAGIVVVARAAPPAPTGGEAERPSSPTPSRPQSPGDNAPVPQQSDSSAPTPAPASEADEHHGAEADEEHGAATPHPVPPERARAAVKAAERFVTAYARPAKTGDPKRWWSQVAPLMTPQGREDYAGTDPTAVPFTKVTGPGKVKPVMGEADLVILVVVPTDSGDMIVHMVGPDHKVSRLTFPTTGTR